jgi:protease I
MKSNKAVIVTGKLVQDHEYIYPYYRLKEAGYDLDVATVDGLETVGQLGAKVLATKRIDQLVVNDYDVVILPGGAKCMEYLRQDKVTINFIRNFKNTDRVIGSICHAAQLLISAKIIKGLRISGYYSLKDDIENAGAIYVDEPAVIAENIVTTAHYKDLGPWMAAVLKLDNSNK